MRVLSLLCILIFIAACDFQYSLPRVPMACSDAATTEGIPADPGSMGNDPKPGAAAIEISKCNVQIPFDTNFLNVILPPVTRNPGKQSVCTLVQDQSFLSTDIKDLRHTNVIVFEIDYKSKLYESHIVINNNQEYGLYNENFILNIFGEDASDKYTLGSISGHNLSIDNGIQHRKIAFELPKQFPSSGHTAIKGITIIIIRHYGESNNFKTEANASLFPEVFFKESTTFAIKKISFLP